MKILAIDSSGMVASAAIVEDDKVLAEFNVNNKKNHSANLLPMIDTLEHWLEIDLKTLYAIAVSKGPGSFTGLRIGSATAKGLALALDLPIIEISTIESMAYQLHGTDKIICPLMDAKRNQVYAGVYQFEGYKLKKILSDKAADITEIIDFINQKNEKVIFLGDGVPAYEYVIKDKLKVAYDFAMPFQNRQRAAALGILAVQYALNGSITMSYLHSPKYLRLSQAERIRMERSDARD